MCLATRGAPTRRRRIVSFAGSDRRTRSVARRRLTRASCGAAAWTAAGAVVLGASPVTGCGVLLGCGFDGEGEGDGEGDGYGAGCGGGASVTVIVPCMPLW